jgi:DNA-binding XRE family transcriptional regulator
MGIVPFGMLNRSQLATLRAAKNGPNRLRLAIDLAGTTQEAVAASVGIRQSYVAKIAAGNYTRLPLETARSLARHFGCAIEDLFPMRRGA